jgi:hypothetical protein
VRDLAKVSIAVQMFISKGLFEEVEGVRLFGCKGVIASGGGASKRKIFHNMTLPIETVIDTTVSALI